MSGEQGDPGVDGIPGRPVSLCHLIGGSINASSHTVQEATRNIVWVSDLYCINKYCN